MPPLISIVVPAYNAGDKIGSTLGSILAQNYENIEIIVVDDASADNTLDAAKHALRPGTRPYKIIEHEINRGVSAARNTGLDASRGEYVQFFDADDLAEVNFISTLYETASLNKADIAFCGYKKRDALSGEETSFPIALDPARAYKGEEVALTHLSGSFVTFMWTMLLRRDFLISTGIRFWDGCFASEDVEFSLKAFVRCKRPVFSRECLYIYVQHDAMTSRSFVTPEQKLARYAARVEGRLRTAEYMAEHAASPAVIKAARYWLVPLWRQKMFNVLAWRGDRKNFDAELRSPEVRAVLWSSRRAFFREPGVFLKTLWMFAFPGAYYAYRLGHIDYNRN